MVSHKINYVNKIPEILNLEGHQNRCICSKVTAILMNGLILPTDGASSGRVCACSLHSRLVILKSVEILFPKTSEGSFKQLSDNESGDI